MMLLARFQPGASPFEKIGEAAVADFSFNKVPKDNPIMPLLPTRKISRRETFNSRSQRSLPGCPTIRNIVSPFIEWKFLASREGLVEMGGTVSD